MADKKEVQKEEPKKAQRKAKVNMMLPSGSVLTIGEAVDLSKEDEAHLAKSFKADDLKHILE